MLNMIIDLLDQMFILWGNEFSTHLYGIAITTGVIALFCRLRGGRKA